MLDRKAIHYSECVDRKVSVSQVLPIQEGAVLCEMVENGASVVYVKATPDGSEKVAGFAILPYNLPSQATSQEQFVVPASGSLVFSLRNSNLVSGSELALVVGGSAMIIDETNFAGTPTTGHVKVDIVGGRIKFAAGDAGSTVKFMYRYNLTVAQARQRFQERSINNRDLVGDLGLLGVLKGYIEISTDQFDTSVNWASASGVYVGPNGLLTSGGPGVVVPGAKILAVPDLSGTLQGPFLKISALIP